MQRLRSHLPLAPVLVLAVLAASACRKGDDDGTVSPDLSKVPSRGPVLREVRNPAGLRIQVLREGSGDEARAGDVVDLRFTGWRPDGTQYDEGYMAGNVIGSPRLDVPQAVDRAALGMRVGELRRVAVPGSWGYTAGRAPAGIEELSPLVLDLERVELLQTKTTDLRGSAGPAARLGDKITVHYVGTLADGTVFDSSRERGKPVTFELKQGKLIEGWTRGIPGMRVGGIRLLEVPWPLGYGTLGNPPKIPPKADLTFEVELVSIP
jgi:peptidylprolyl isomerase/FKBP-type peptidyl-prolyl cis-trans isomerase FkpA